MCYTRRLSERAVRQKNPQPLTCTKIQGFYAAAMNEGKPYTIGALACLVKRGQAIFSEALVKVQAW